MTAFRPPCPELMQSSREYCGTFSTDKNISGTTANWYIFKPFTSSGAKQLQFWIKASVTVSD